MTLVQLRDAPRGRLTWTASSGLPEAESLQDPTMVRVHVEEHGGHMHEFTNVLYDGEGEGE